MRTDPIEQTSAYQRIENEVDAAALAAADAEAVAAGFPPRVMGSVHVFWRHKKRLLRERYGIKWSSPAELNPEIMFD